MPSFKTAARCLCFVWISSFIAKNPAEAFTLCAPGHVASSQRLATRPLQKCGTSSQILRRIRGGQGRIDGLEMAKSSAVGATGTAKAFLRKVMGPTKVVLGFIAASFSWLVEELTQLSKNQKLLFMGAFCLGLLLGRMRPFWKRVVSVNDVSNSDFGPKARVWAGRAATVSDGDTIRFLHVPTIFNAKALKKGEKASESTLQVRLCTIDTPETAKFGKPGQAFGKEAKEYLTKLLENKRVFIRMLQRDQYGRAVCQVFTKSFGKRKFMDEAMLEEGFAEVYEGSGAVYGPKGKDVYLDMQGEARKKKKGIWSQKNRESAAEYKKRTK